MGRRMVEHASARLNDEGCTLSEVKTLAKESGYVPYEGTRRFYERPGFRLVETVSPFPSWEPGNLCAFYVRPL